MSLDDAVQLAISYECARCRELEAQLAEMEALRDNADIGQAFLDAIKELEPDAYWDECPTELYRRALTGAICLGVYTQDSGEIEIVIVGEDGDPTDREVQADSVLEEFSRLRAELAAAQKVKREADAEVAACLVFLDTEMRWEYFREQILFSGPDDVEKKNASLENARRLQARLKATGHGIALLRDLAMLRDHLAAAQAALIRTSKECGEMQTALRQAGEALQEMRRTFIPWGDLGNQVNDALANPVLRALMAERRQEAK